MTDTDPHPECEHDWRPMGLSTICEPPIRHRGCPKCRTFQHTSLFSMYAGSKWDTGPESVADVTRYSKEWRLGPWSDRDWERL